MNIAELKTVLEENKINPNCYELCASKRLGTWQIFYSENSYTWIVKNSDKDRNAKFNEFADENSACEFFLQEILSDPTSFLDFSMNKINEFYSLGKTLTEKYCSN